MVADARRARLDIEHLELALQAAGLGEFQYDVPGDFYVCLLYTSDAADE